MPLFNRHKHHWHEIKTYCSQEEPHGEFFTKTVYYNLLKCCGCGETKQDIYNWSYREKGTPNTDEDEHMPDQSCIHRVREKREVFG